MHASSTSTSTSTAVKTIRSDPRRRLATAAAMLAAVLALAGTATSPPRARSAPLERIEGGASTSIQVANLDRERSAAALITFNNCSRPPSQITSSWVPITPLGALSRNLWNPSGGYIPRPACGASIASPVSVEQTFAALVHTEWPSSARPAASVYRAVRPATDVIVPYYIKRGTGDNVGLAVMIDGDEAADIDLTLYDRNGAVALQTRYVFTAREARILPLHQTAAVPLGFVGWARLRSSTALGAVGIIDGLGGHSAAAFEGVASAGLSSTLYAPLVRWSDDRGQTSLTTIWVANPSDTAVRVTARYDGLAAPCGGRTWTNAQRTIAPHAMATFDPRADGLMVGCAAALTLTADGPVAAAVVDAFRSLGNRFEGAYTTLTAADAERLVLLPVMRNRYQNGQFTTAAVVHNTAAVAADVTLTVADDMGTPLPLCQGCRTTIPPGGAHLFAATLAPFMPGRSAGSARIDSDQPVVVVVSEHSEVGLRDSSIYPGIGVPDEPVYGTLLAPYTPNGANDTWQPPVDKRYFPWGDATRP
ncbi:MAG: hypothetical protein IT332_00360 [Ardenticatenales bacterium]|nr:hypothetical protein [Ardenticatenales bacterium]